MRLVEWVWEYYAREPPRPPGAASPQPAKLQSSPVIVSGRPPLYFQHQVHRCSCPGCTWVVLKPVTDASFLAAPCMAMCALTGNREREKTR